MPFTLLHSAAQCARLESSKSLCSHVNGACASVLFHRTILSPPWPLASLQNSNQWVFGLLTRHSACHFYFVTSFKNVMTSHLQTNSYVLIILKGFSSCSWYIFMGKLIIQLIQWMSSFIVFSKCLLMESGVVLLEYSSWIQKISQL